MKQRRLFVVLSQVMTVSVLLGACAAPVAVPTSTIPPAPTAVVLPTAAPTTAPTGAATTAPTTAPTVAPTTAATTAPTAATAAPGGPKKGGTLTLADNGDYATLDLFTATWAAYAAGAMYDDLIEYKPDFSGFVPVLASAWTISPDNLSVTFTLRPGVKFHDGTPMDAAAVKWNLDRYRDKTVASPASDQLVDLLTNVTAPDDHTVVLTLAQPYGPLFDVISRLAIASPTAFQKVSPNDWGQSPVGTGAWVVKDQVSNDHRTFARNPDYAWAPAWFDNKAAVYPDQLTIKYLTDDATTYSALETGQVQIGPIPAQFLPQARANTKITVVPGLVAGLDYLGFNTQFAPFDNPNIRKAIGLAINRDEVIKAGYSGEAEAIYGPLSPDEFGYSQAAETEARKQSFNVNTAKSMLAAEGYVAGSDGILAKAGQKMDFRFIFPTDDKSKRMAETIQSQLFGVGIKLTLAPEDANTVLKPETVKGTAQIFLLYFELIDPRILCFQFCSANINGTDRTRYKNDALDKVLAAANAELDPDQRKALVEQAEMIIIDQRPEIPLDAVHQFFGFRNDLVGGVKFDATGSPQFQDAYLLNP